MEIRDFYRLILKNLITVVLSTILGIGASSVLTYMETPIYEAKAQLFVSTQSSEVDLTSLIQGSSFTQQRVKSYAQIIPSPTTLAPVIRQLGLKISPDKLSSRVKASAPLDTVLINLSVSDESPQQAALLANSIGIYFSQFVNELELANTDNTPPIKVSVVKRASIPTIPASPRVSLNLLLGLILGFGVGVGIAILRQIFDNTIKNEDQLEETPLLGAIPFDKQAEARPLILQLDKYSARTESFRQLRTNLQYLKIDNPPKVISITSALPGEGKTSTSLNLALSLCQTGFKVIFVEADLRRPKVSKYLKITGQFGLSEILTKQIPGEILERISAATSVLDGALPLDFIASGALPPNPAELLDSDIFAEFLNQLRPKYDFVILDCPPSLPVADASIISTRSDGVLIVVEAGKTKVNQYIGVRDSITAVGGFVLGVVLNKIPYTKRYDDYGYRYGYSYGYQRGYHGVKSNRPYASDFQEFSEKTRTEE
jgi:non-specific protein-tyrosine kinase